MCGFFRQKEKRLIRCIERVHGSVGLTGVPGNRTKAKDNCRKRSSNILLVRLAMYFIGLALEVVGIFLGISSFGMIDTIEAVGALFLAGAALFVAGYLIARGPSKL